jgi:hypothetical protein
MEWSVSEWWNPETCQWRCGCPLSLVSPKLQRWGCADAGGATYGGEHVRIALQVEVCCKPGQAGDESAALGARGSPVQLLLLFIAPSVEGTVSRPCLVALPPLRLYSSASEGDLDLALIDSLDMSVFQILKTNITNIVELLFY